MVYFILKTYWTCFQTCVFRFFSTFHQLFSPYSLWNILAIFSYHLIFFSSSYYHLVQAIAVSCSPITLTLGILLVTCIFVHMVIFRQISRQFSLIRFLKFSTNLQILSVLVVLIYKYTKITLSIYSEWSKINRNLNINKLCALKYFFLSGIVVILYIQHHLHCLVHQTYAELK